MKSTTIFLVALVVVGLSLATPVAAEDGGDEDGPCVKLSLDPPGVLVDPRCHPLISEILDELPYP